MSKKLETLVKYVKHLVSGVLCGVAGLMIFVLLFSQLGASVEWVTSNAYLGTIVFGGAIILYTSRNTRYKS